MSDISANGVIGALAPVVDKRFTEYVSNNLTEAALLMPADFTDMLMFNLLLRIT